MYQRVDKAFDELTAFEKNVGKEMDCTVSVYAWVRYTAIRNERRLMFARIRNSVNGRDYRGCGDSYGNDRLQEETEHLCPFRGIGKPMVVEVVPMALPFQYVSTEEWEDDISF